MASALGRVAVEVPQIQFIDAVVLEQFQFLDKFLVGPLLCNDSSVARGVQYIDNCRCTCVMQWQVCCIGALLRNAWLDSGYMFCDSSGCVGCIVLFST